MSGSGDAHVAQKRAKGRPDEEDYNYQKTSRYRAAQKRIKRKHDGGGQDASTGGTTTLGNGMTGPASRGWQGMEFFEKWRMKDVTQKG